MKLNELLTDFNIQMSNEEQEVLQRCKSVRPLHTFSERDKFVIEGLIRKSLVSKIIHNGDVLVVTNEIQ